MNLNKLLVEFLGTYVFILVIIITGNAWLIGLTLSLLIYNFGKVSGGSFNPDVGVSFNPAVTIMLVMDKKLSLSELIPNISAQILGTTFALQTCKLLKLDKN